MERGTPHTAFENTSCTEHVIGFLSTGGAQTAIAPDQGRTKWFSAWQVGFDSYAEKCEGGRRGGRRGGEGEGHVINGCIALSDAVVFGRPAACASAEL